MTGELYEELVAAMIMSIRLLGFVHSLRMHTTLKTAHWNEKVWNVEKLAHN